MFKLKIPFKKKSERAFPRVFNDHFAPRTKGAMMIREHRRSTRLQLDKGVVVLRYSGYPALACAIIDISDSGCRCEFDLNSTNAASCEAWLSILKCGLRTSTMVKRPPSLMNVELMGEVVHAKKLGEKLSLGISFISNAEQTTALRQAMIALAREKLYPHGITPGSLPVDLSEVQQQPGSISSQEARSTRKASPATSTSITRYMMENRSASPADVCQALAIQSGLPITNLEDCNVPAHLRRIFTYLTMQRHEFVPVSESKEMLSIAAAHPLNDKAIKEIEMIAGREVLVSLAPLDQIQDLQFRIRPRGQVQDRHHPRVKSELGVAYVFCNEEGVNLDNTVRHGTIGNLSDGGFLIIGPAEAEHSLKDLSRRGICARIQFECYQRDIHALCRIRHVTARKAGDQGEEQWQFGVEIIRIEPGEAAYLKYVCIRHVEQASNQLSGAGE
jgi:hypothetical protein